MHAKVLDQSLEVFISPWLGSNCKGGTSGRECTSRSLPLGDARHDFMNGFISTNQSSSLRTERQKARGDKKGVSIWHDAAFTAHFR